MADIHSEQPNDQAKHAHSPLHDSRVMRLDTQTLKDLEIFESQSAASTLFDLCNHTRSEKGAEILRTRMKKPWTEGAPIREVQASLLFLMEQRQAFDRLPSYVTTDQVEEYFDRSLPLITTNNAVEYCYSVLEIRFGDYSRYVWIQRGVEAVANLVRTLRVIVNNPALAAPRGELALLLAEMKTLIARPGLAAITEEKVWDQGPWKILRSDRIFRMREKSAIARLLQLIYEIDALLSLADTTRKQGFVMPHIEEGPLFLEADDLFHPLVDKAVPNPAGLNQTQRLLFLTGPNMAGKTTYLRACAIALYLAHLGMGVPAGSFRFVPAQCLFTSISLADDLHKGVSFFRAEGLRVKAIAEALAQGYRVIALMDEPFKGTNVKDALDASRVILESFAARQESLFMFSSHLIELSEAMQANKQVDCRYFEADEKDGNLGFDFTLKPGVSSQRLGIRVLQEEGIFDLLNNGKVTS